MNDREDKLNVLMQAIGEEGCGIACEEATVLKDKRGWKFMEFPTSAAAGPKSGQFN